MEMIWEMGSQWITADAGESRAYEEQMVINNRIGGILEMELLQQNGEKKYRYDVTGGRNLVQLTEEMKLSGDILKELFGTLEKTVTGARRYLLREEGFLLKPELIFRTEEGFMLCYHPGNDSSLRDQLLSLSEWLLGRLEVTDRTAVYAGYRIHVLCREEGLNFRSLSEIFSEEAGAGPEGREEGSDDREEEAELPAVAEKASAPEPEEPCGKVRKLFLGYGRTIGELLMLAAIIGILLYMIP